MGDSNFLYVVLNSPTFLIEKVHVLFILPRESTSLTKTLILPGDCGMAELRMGLKVPHPTANSPQPSLLPTQASTHFEPSCLTCGGDNADFGGAWVFNGVIYLNVCSRAYSTLLQHQSDPWLQWKNSGWVICKLLRGADQNCSQELLGSTVHLE